MTKLSQVVVPMAFAFTALMSGAAGAQANGDWHGNAILYGYLPSIGGSTAFPNASSPISVNASNIIGDLKGAFMGSLQFGRGAWGLYNDVMLICTES